MSMPKNNNNKKINKYNNIKDWQVATRTRYDKLQHEHVSYCLLGTGMSVCRTIYVHDDESFE